VSVYKDKPTGRHRWKIIVDVPTSGRARSRQNTLFRFSGHTPVGLGKTSTNRITCSRRCCRQPGIRWADQRIPAHARFASHAILPRAGRSVNAGNRPPLSCCISHRNRLRLLCRDDRSISLSGIALFPPGPIDWLDIRRGLGPFRAGHCSPTSPSQNQNRPVPGRS